MKNTNKKARFLSMLLALCAAAMLASCAAAPAGSGCVNASEPSSVSSVEIKEESVPSASFDATVTDVHSEKIDDKKTNTQNADNEIDYVRFMKDPAYADRCIADDIAKIAGIESKPERYDSACVVDMRKSETAYDVNWDYGEEYENFNESVGRPGRLPAHGDNEPNYSLKCSFANSYFARQNHKLLIT